MKVLIAFLFTALVVVFVGVLLAITGVWATKPPKK